MSSAAAYDHVDATEAPTAVLVVDDDEAFRRTTCRILAARGYRIVQAADAGEARTRLEGNGDVAAVLCDIRMPGMSGLDLLREIAQDFPDVAVLMTTGLDDPRVADLAFEIGAFGYVVKPFDRNELIINLASALRRRELEMAHRVQIRDLERAATRARRLSGVLDGLEGSTPETSDDTVLRLAHAVSLRGDAAAVHLERMSRYCAILADAVGLDRLSSEEMRLASALHDVGEIGIPDSVLTKAGPLTSDEHMIKQRHARLGYELLAGSRSPVIAVAADIALTHHEWWDGGGYPRGLQSEEIPIEGRIAAVADVFDALTSDRPHRPAMAVDEAMAVISELRGRQFEPRLVDAFLGSMGAVLAVRAQFQAAPASGIRVLVVDDHAIFAESLVRLLGARPDINVVGRVATIADAAAAAVAHAPDVIVMDFELPDGDGPDGAALIKAAVPSAQVVMLTARTDEAALVRAISAGCAGFVTKQEAVDSLVDAIVAAHQGEPIARVTSLAPLLDKLRPSHRGLGSTLTKRELEILNLLATGLVNKQIARELTVSLNTVRNHVQNILGKLDAHSRLEAVATAVREGLISPSRAPAASR